MAQIIRQGDGYSFSLTPNFAAKSRFDALSSTAKTRFLNDCLDNPALLKAFNTQPELVEAWKKLDNWGRPNLKKDIPTLESLQKIIGSDKLKGVFDDLDSYEMYEQVQFTYNKSTGDYFVADQAFVKYGFDADGDKFIENIIVIENKLSDAIKLTGNQSTARSISEYTVRSRQISGLDNGLEVSSNNWLRVYGDGSGQNIIDITDEFK